MERSTLVRLLSHIPLGTGVVVYDDHDPEAVHPLLGRFNGLKLSGGEDYISVRLKPKGAVQSAEAMMKLDDVKVVAMVVDD